MLGAAMLSPNTAVAEDQDPIVSAVEATDGIRNFAVNLPEGTASDVLDAAASEAEGLGAVVLIKYPQLSTMFVQSDSASFAQDFADALATAGIPLESVGPTRTAVIDRNDKENVVDPSGISTMSVTQLSEKSQFYKEEQLWADDDPGNDPDTSETGAWGVLALQADKAREITENDVTLAPVTVGVIDAGVDSSHPDLAAQIDKSQSVSCAVNGVPDTSEAAWQPTTSSHGTHVAATIAGAHDGAGVDGVAPYVKIAAVKAGNDAGFLYPEYVTCGMVWSAEHHFDVTNNSYYVDPWEYWVPTDPSQAAGYEAVRRSVEYAIEQGVTTVAAAGNSNTDLDNLTTDSGSPNDTSAIPNRDVHDGFNIPTMLPGVVTVSAVGKQDFYGDMFPLRRSSFSNYGKNTIDVAAPGEYIWSAVDPDIDGENYGYMSGTSMASPHAAGVAALIKGIHPDYTPEQVLALMKKQASENDYANKLAAPTDGKEYRGAGLVDALAVVTEDQPQPVIGSVEYSTDDGATWNALEGATVSGKGKVRVNVTGPVSQVTLTVGGETALQVVDEPSFDGSVSAEVDVDFSALDATAKTASAKSTADASDTAAVAKVSANGLNSYEGADDDVASETSFTAAPAQAVVPPEPDVDEGGENTDNDDSTVSADDENADADAMPATGSAVGGVAVVAMLLTLGGVTALRLRRRD